MAKYEVAAANKIGYMRCQPHTRKEGGDRGFKQRYDKNDEGFDAKERIMKANIR